MSGVCAVTGGIRPRPKAVARAASTVSQTGEVAKRTASRFSGRPTRRTITRPKIRADANHSRAHRPRRQGAAMAVADLSRVRYRDALAFREYRALLAATTISVCGSVVSYVALTVLVYERTRSPFLASLAF